MGALSKVILYVSVHPESTSQEPGELTPVRPGWTTRRCGDRLPTMETGLQRWAAVTAGTPRALGPGTPREWREVLVPSEPLGFSLRAPPEKPGPGHKAFRNPGGLSAS